MDNSADQYEFVHIEHAFALSKGTEQLVSSACPSEQRDLHEIKTPQF